MKLIKSSLHIKYYMRDHYMNAWLFNICTFSPRRRTTFWRNARRLAVRSASSHTPPRLLPFHKSPLLPTLNVPLVSQAPRVEPRYTLSPKVRLPLLYILLTLTYLRVLVFIFVFSEIIIATAPWSVDRHVLRPRHQPSPHTPHLLSGWISPLISFSQHFNTKL